MPVHKLMIGGEAYTIYIGLLAFMANVIVALAANLALRAAVPEPRPVRSS